jgi:hypothetical protein
MAKTKSAGANNTRSLAMSLAPALYALAFDIQDDLRFAVPAVNRQMLCLGFWRYSEQSFVPFADRTRYPSICYVDYTTIVVSGQ